MSSIYKRRTIVAIAPREGMVVVTLACGHFQYWYPYANSTGARTAEQYAQDIQREDNPFIVGKTRIRCKGCEAREEARL